MSHLVRPRRVDDLPGLSEALLEQQPLTRYPLRNPLPVPISEFLHYDDAVAAWTATIDSVPIGHISVTRSHSGVNGGTEFARACAAAHQCDVADLLWISAFFVGSRARRLGIGRELLRIATDSIIASGNHPCLEVVPARPAALRLYEADGWCEVMRVRPAWIDQLPDGDGLKAIVMIFPTTGPRRSDRSALDDNAVIRGR